MRVPRCVLCVLASSIVACGPTLSEVARVNGARDLGCPSEQVSAYAATDGRYVARGCGKWVEYVCDRTRSGQPTCFAPGKPEVR